MAGLPKGGHLYRLIRNNEIHLNSELAEQDVMSAAMELEQAAKSQFGVPLNRGFDYIFTAVPLTATIIMPLVSPSTS